MLTNIFGKKLPTGTKKIRSGKGKMRGRKYKKTKGILFITTPKSNLFNAAKNLEGSEVIDVKNLNVTVLAPGGRPGRITIWSEGAIKKMNEEKLFT
jgi:large subunit ribosomal protein L4e